MSATTAGTFAARASMEGGGSASWTSGSAKTESGACGGADRRSVGVSQATVDRGEVPARVVKLPLATNPRAKMGGIRDGFVKIFARPGTGLVLGGVVVAPRASELILPLSIAIEQNLSVDQIAHTFSIYPSLSGSVTEAARTVMEFGTDAIL